MKLYLIKQDVNNDYDTYDCAVVAATDEKAARHTKVGGGGSWCEPKDVYAKLIGTAAKGIEGVVCASFNAG